MLIKNQFPTLAQVGQVFTISTFSSCKLRETISKHGLRFPSVGEATRKITKKTMKTTISFLSVNIPKAPPGNAAAYELLSSIVGQDPAKGQGSRAVARSEILIVMGSCS